MSNAQLRTFLQEIDKELRAAKGSNELLAAIDNVIEYTKHNPLKFDRGNHSRRVKNMYTSEYPINYTDTAFSYDYHQFVYVDKRTELKMPKDHTLQQPQDIYDALVGKTKLYKLETILNFLQLIAKPNTENTNTEGHLA